MSAMPDSTARAHDGDCMTDSEMRDMEARVIARRDAKLADMEWWNLTLSGVNPITAEIATVLSRCAMNALAVSRAKGRGLELLDMGTAIAMNRFMLTIAKQYAEAEAREELVDIPDYLENV